VDGLDDYGKKMKPRRTDYWSDYSPEPAIVFYRGKKPSPDASPFDPNVFLVWEGFFDPIHTALLDRHGHGNLPNEFTGWNECRGWHDGGSEMINDPEFSASSLAGVTIDDLRNVSNDSYAEGVEDCIADLVLYLRESLELEMPVFIHNGFFTRYAPH
jgi:hypothetical protein